MTKLDVFDDWCRKFSPSTPAFYDSLESPVQEHPSWFEPTSFPNSDACSGLWWNKNRAFSAFNCEADATSDETCPNLMSVKKNLIRSAYRKWQVALWCLFVKNKIRVSLF